jgi:hypothetical protein
MTSARDSYDWAKSRQIPRCARDKLANQNSIGGNGTSP